MQRGKRRIKAVLSKFHKKKKSTTSGIVRKSYVYMVAKNVSMFFSALRSMDFKTVLGKGFPDDLYPDL